MNCANCGNALAPNARFCSHCGAFIVQTQPVQTQPIQHSQPAAAYTTFPGFLPYNRVARHIQTLGFLWFAYAIWRTITKVFAVSLLHGILGIHGIHGHTSFDQDWTSMGHFGLASLWPVIAMSLLIGLAISAATAYGLLHRQPWGRVLGIIAGILALFHPILGTALGIYTLWVLAPSLSGIEYAAMASPSQRLAH